ncbi:MAG: Maf family protein [Bacteroidota bacterium]
MEKLSKSTVVLASKSPRRRELLQSIGVNVDVRPIEVEENYPQHLSAPETALFLAALKASACPAPAPGEIWLTSDTVVSVSGQILGKPADKKEALKMLRLLSGKKHEVITAVCLRSDRMQRSFYETTRVTFKRLTTAELHYYIDTYKPYDKAGAYGIQEWIGMIGIEKIKGCYYNVMGLPLNKVYTTLSEFHLPE